MTAKYVIEIYNFLLENKIQIWIDGGWCVDALLGKQTREHPDLDIAVNRKDNNKLQELLESKGYVEKKRPDSAEWMYVMKNKEDEQIDVHVFDYDENGKNIYGIEYPLGSLTGKGKIDNQTIRCISPEWMFKFKTAYEPKEKDIKDVQGLSKKFGFDLPHRYRVTS